MPNPIPRKTSEDVRTREQGRCLRCQSPGTDCHHRKRRREGGHAIENIVLLCRSCHNWAHANPEQARKEGFIVSVWGDVSETPIKAWYGWIKLRDEGFVEYGVSPGFGGP